MKKLIQGVAICFALTMQLSCKKEYMADNAFGLNTSHEKDLINRGMRMDGQLIDGDMPAAHGSAGLSINSHPTAVQVSAGVILYISYTVTDTNVCKLYLKVEGAESYWEARVNHGNSSHDFYLQVFIPNFVKDGNFDLVYSVGDCNGNISSPVTTGTSVTPPLGCGDGISGSVGVTVAHYVLGDNGGKVTIHYDMYTAADRLDVKYKGNWIKSTAAKLLASTSAGPPGQSPNTITPYVDIPGGFIQSNGTVTFSYDSSDRDVYIYVTGGGGGTLWDVSVDCP